MKKKKLKLKKQPFFILVCGLLLLCGYAFYQLVTIQHVDDNQLVSDQVKDYHDDLTKYARENDIEDYVGLLEAMMMQESRGSGDDPMQSSECEFNEIYKKAPGAIEDPQYSIEVGVKYFAKCLNSAKVTSLDDSENIFLALQAYNFGVGYVDYALKEDGGYTYDNAIGFSEKCKSDYDIDVYGDTKYVYHVLRYYQDTQLVDQWMELYH